MAGATCLPGPPNVFQRGLPQSRAPLSFLVAAHFAARTARDHPLKRLRRLTRTPSHNLIRGNWPSVDLPTNPTRILMQSYWSMAVKTGYPLRLLQATYSRHVDSCGAPRCEFKHKLTRLPCAGQTMRGSQTDTQQDKMRGQLELCDSELMLPEVSTEGQFKKKGKLITKNFRVWK